MANENTGYIIHLDSNSKHETTNGLVLGCDRTVSGFMFITFDWNTKPDNSKRERKIKQKGRPYPNKETKDFIIAFVHFANDVIDESLLI